MLHDKLHDIFLNRNASSCIGPVDPEAVHEKSESFFPLTLCIISHIQAILISMLVIRDALTVFSIQPRYVPDGDQFVKMHAPRSSPDQ